MHKLWLAAALAASALLAAACAESSPTDSPQTGGQDVVAANQSAASGAQPAAKKSPSTAASTAVAEPSGNASSTPVKRGTPPADARNPDGTYGKKRIDPVKLNGPIFKGWPKPKVALVFSGAQDGYIEPCGCAGLENQKGGLSRRHQLLKKMAASGWPVAAFDAGGLVKRFGRQSELKFAASVEGLKQMGYAAVTLGGEDLRLSLDELISAVTSVDDKPSPFVATNVALLSFQDKLVARYRVAEAGGMRFGVLAVLGEEEQQKVRNDELQFKPAAQAIAEVLPQLKREKCDKLILLAHTTLKEATELGKRYGELDYVVTTAGAAEPPAEPTKIGRRTQLIEVGHKGMYCVVLGLYDDAAMPQRYQRVPIDARFGESPEMKQLLVSYQDQLKDLGLAGLGLIPERGSPKHPKGQQFVGSATCGECHTKAYEVWKNTPHSHATDTIVNLSPARHFDPECLSCHSTGWEPQRYFPFASGYMEEKQAHLHGNGCENCHGPGSRHAAAQLGDIDVTDQELKALQRAMRVTKQEAEKNLCVQCHDIDNSPAYHWEEYWPQVEHIGKD
jgi:hypothetical protein